MSSVSSPTLDNPSVSHSPRNPDDLKHLVSGAFSVLNQPPPPSLREILSAYRAKGDGDRDMLLAMLNAKSAEDQRIASVTALQRMLLEIFQPSRSNSHHYHHSSVNGAGHHYPASAFTQPPHICDKKLRRQHHQSHHHRAPSRSRSPPRVIHHPNLPSMRDRDGPLYHQDHLSRKRHRSSLSPPRPYDIRPLSQHGSQHDHLPPSPYSSCDSAEYSPRSRTSMAIGSLLSTGPSQEVNADES